MNLRVKRIQHIGVPVTDLTRSVVFYERLGFENVMSSSFEHKGGQGTVAMMQSGEIIMELYQMPQSELSEISSREDGHIDHVAFDVENIDEAFQELTAAGFTVLEEAPVYLPFWKKGCKYFNIKGPDGERLEYNQIV